MEEVKNTAAQDTQAAPQQPVPAPAPPVEVIEIVDTAKSAPEAAPEVPPTLIAGKYRSIEEAEKAYSEAQRAMHEKAQEAATYRKLLEERAAAPTPPPFHAPAEDFDNKFRERLAENPAQVIFEMTRFATKQALEEQQKSQREVVKQFQSYAVRPEFAPVAQQVASQLPFINEQQISPIEGLFLREKVRQLEAMLSSGNIAAPRPANPPFVMPGGAAPRTGTNTLKVELDPDTARLGVQGDKLRELAKLVAKQKAAGGSMSGMSIDDWEKINA